MRSKFRIIAAALGTAMALGISSDAYCGWDSLEMTLDSEHMTQPNLPEMIGPRYPIVNGDWPKYGAQARTAQELRAEKFQGALLAAQDLVHQKKYAEALQKLQEADALPNKTPEEAYLVERSRLAIAARSNNDGLMQQAGQAILANGYAAAAEQQAIANYLTRVSFNHKSYDQAIRWANIYFKNGGIDADLRDSLPKSYYLTKNYAEAVSSAKSSVDAYEKAGKIPPKLLIDLWIDSASRLNDTAQRYAALEKSVTYYPARDQWVELLNRLANDRSLPDDVYIDIYRLMYASGYYDTLDDRLNIAGGAIEIFHGEFARRVLDAAAKVNNAKETPPAKQRQLLAKAEAAALLEEKGLEKQAAQAEHAKNGAVFISMGQVYLDQGKLDTAISLMERGIKLGGLRAPNMAKLKLGIAYALAQRTQEANALLQQLDTDPGLAPLASYWRILIKSRERSTVASNLNY